LVAFRALSFQNVSLVHIDRGFLSAQWTLVRESLKYELVFLGLFFEQLGLISEISLVFGVGEVLKIPEDINEFQT
jgi:hypothetical protein